MSTINVSNLILTLQQKIDSSTSETDLLYYSKAIQQLRTTNIFVVNNMSQLPNPQQNLYTLYYVQAEEALYISIGLTWFPINPNQTERSIFTWGSGGFGVLGDGTTTTRVSPAREISSSTNWCQVSGGGIHTLALKTSGQLWGWGYNSSGGGRLGVGAISGGFCSPVRELCCATDWCQVSAGNEHSMAIKTSGQLWVWGVNACGVLGDGTATARVSPVREICSATDWCQVRAGCTHSAAVKTTGQIWLWGNNGCGRLGNGTTTTICSPVREFCSATDWRQVSTGSSHTAAIKTSGELWTWGNSSGGALGVGTGAASCSPVREFCSATDWCFLTLNFNSTNNIAIKTSGQMWVWGGNECGRLGDGTLTTSRCSPVREFCSATDWCQASAGFRSSAAVKTSGELWAWGSNSCGVLGDGTLENRCSPVREISSSTNWCQVAMNSTSTPATAAILSSN